MYRSLIFAAFFLALALLCGPQQAHAAGGGGTGCTVTGSNLSVPGYSPLSAAASTSNSSLATISCSMSTFAKNSSVPLMGCLSGGDSGSVLPSRYMQGVSPLASTNHLLYQIYYPSATSTIIGDNTNGAACGTDSTSVKSNGNGGVGNASIFLSSFTIPAQQDVPVGSYREVSSLTLTVNF